VFDPLNEDDFLDTLLDVISKKDNLQEMGIESKNIIRNYSPKTAAKSIFNAIKIAEKQSIKSV
jgi:hypothetical protein